MGGGTGGRGWWGGGRRQGGGWRLVGEEGGEQLEKEGEEAQ